MTTYGDIPGVTYGDAPSGGEPPRPDFTGIDPELIVTTELRLDGELAALVEGVSTELPVPLPVPWLRVVLQPGSTQADGGHPDHRLHRYRLSVETWDRDKVRARDVTNVVTEVVLGLPGIHAGGIVTDAALEGLPYWLPDPDDDYARYVTPIAVTLHAP